MHPTLNQQRALRLNSTLAHLAVRLRRARAFAFALALALPHCLIMMKWLAGHIHSICVLYTE